jgi:hypothetical protein
LPPVAFCIGYTRLRCHGYYCPGHNWYGFQREILLNERHLLHSIERDEFPEVIVITGHELLHAWQDKHGTPGSGNYHNAQFRAKAVACGLTVDSRGYTKLDPDGPLARLFTTHGVAKIALPEGVRIMPAPSKLHKWVCGCHPPYGVRVAIEDFRASCHHCGQKFEREYCHQLGAACAGDQAAVLASPARARLPGAGEAGLGAGDVPGGVRPGAAGPEAEDLTRRTTTMNDDQENRERRERIARALETARADQKREEATREATREAVRREADNPHRVSDLLERVLEDAEKDPAFYPAVRDDFEGFTPPFYPADPAFYPAVRDDKTWGSCCARSRRRSCGPGCPGGPTGGVGMTTPGAST